MVVTTNVVSLDRFHLDRALIVVGFEEPLKMECKCFARFGKTADRGSARPPFYLTIPTAIKDSSFIKTSCLSQHVEMSSYVNQAGNCCAYDVKSNLDLTCERLECRL